MPISSLWKLGYHAPTDPADVPTDLGNLTTDLDAWLCTGYGTLAARPAASATWPGYTYYATDTGVIYRSDRASTWAAITTAVALVTPDAVMISDTTLGSDGTLDLTSIPATYKHLKLILNLRFGLAAVADEAAIQFNGDTGATQYRTASIYNAGGSAGFLQSGGTTRIVVANLMAASNAAANIFTSMVIEIPDYASTTRQKNAIGTFGPSSDGQTQVGTVSGGWKSTAAINRIRIYPSNGGTNWKAGSRATLYGLK